ncbi:MAG: hypothetical protein AAGJ31_04530, partial [Verrucomicrobiota bacterium]
YHRKQDARYKRVLDQMRSTAAVAELRDGAEHLTIPLHGRGILMAEFWSDTLDRWAEELVEAPGQGGAGGGQSGGGSGGPSLPPEIVLKVMKILRDEIALREETRELEQARKGLDRPEFLRRTKQLTEAQRELRNQTAGAANRIKSIPLGEQNFEREIGLLMDVAKVMGDAQQILAEPDTGERAIAAETEAIELLLESQRNDQNGGGGGSSSPSGMAGMMASFLESLKKAKKVEGAPSRAGERSVEQATGKGGRELPEEFRSGLDQYFNALERRLQP